jgi:hypothetical protein
MAGRLTPARLAGRVAMTIGQRVGAVPCEWKMLYGDALKEETRMQAQYVRLFTDERGVSLFDDKEIELVSGFAVPPAEPLHFAEFLDADSSFWIGAPTDWRGDESHPAPRRQIFITVRGEYQVTAGDGAVRRFPAGSVLFLEDTTGTGHSTRIIGADDCIIFAVGLRPKK